jgi:RNA polymerase sigma-70 factor (ECF subfamily)
METIESVREESKGIVPVAPAGRPPGRAFETTRWSVVLRAAQTGGGDALAELCEAYWQPVYVFIRCLGVPPEHAEDVTQDFFAATLLERNSLSAVSPERGRFRAWIRRCVRNYVGNWRKRRGSIVTGGRAVHVAFDPVIAEELVDRASTEHCSPDRLFDRCVALRMVELAKERLLLQYADHPHLPIAKDVWLAASDPDKRCDADFANELRMSQVAVRAARFRVLRNVFPACMREEVGQTVSSPAEIDAEIRHLLESLE